MPRNQPVDWERVYKAIDESPSLSAAARALGLHLNTVWKATKRREGLCHLCFREPAVPPSTHCDTCRKYMRDYQKNRLVQKKAERVCVQCNQPLSPTSRTYCELHRQMVVKDARNQRSKEKAKDPEGFLAKQRANNRRQKYGEGANQLWDGTQGACQICAAPYRKRRNHIHHIDHDARNNAPDNLIVVCYRCHRLIHAVLNHPSPALVIAWLEHKHPVPPPLPPEAQPDGPFRKWEWRTAQEPR